MDGIVASRYLVAPIVGIVAGDVDNAAVLRGRIALPLNVIFLILMIVVYISLTHTQ